RVERFHGVAAHVLSNAVKDHDGVVDREADDCEHRRHKQRVNLEIEEEAKDRPEAEHYKRIVKQRKDGAGPETDRELYAAYLTEGDGDVDQDKERSCRDRQEGHEGLLARDGRTDRVGFNDIDRAELLLELLDNLIEAWSLGGGLGRVDQIGLR